MKVRLIFAVAALCAGTPLMALGSPSASQSTKAPTNRPALPKLILPNSSSQIGDISVPNARLEAGQSIPITFTISNPTKADAVYNFQTGQKFDITVLNSKGIMVWQWSHGKQFKQNLSRVVIAPGKTEKFNAIWDSRDLSGKVVPPGDYTINARTTSNNGTAITGGFVVNNDTDPNNMGVTTRTPAETGAIRQMDTTPPVTATKRIVLVASQLPSHSHARG